jgi:hypothetical protein
MLRNRTGSRSPWLTALAMFASLSVHASDIEAGKTKVQQLCADCHRPKDWSGETNAALESLIKDVVAGKVKHSQRQINLTPQEISDIAAYWTSGRK